MGWTRSHNPADVCPDLGHQVMQLLIAQVIDERVVTTGFYALAEHHDRPRALTEHLVILPYGTGIAFEQGDLVRQAIRYRHLAAIDPVFRIKTLIDLVVQDNEVPDLLYLFRGLVVELPDLDRIDVRCGKHPHQSQNAVLNKVDTGRFKRLEEAAGQAYRHAVFDPLLRSSTGAELDGPHVIESFAFDIAQQGLLRILVSEIATAVHKAVANPVLQRYFPLPTTGPGGGAGIRGRR